MTSNLLCFNSAKTEFLLLGLKPQLNKIHNPALTLSNGASVCPSPSARNLDFIFDAHLTFSGQISSLARSCFYHIRDLRHIRPVFDFSTAHIIGTSLVHSKLDYCNSLYYGLPKTQLTRLQQNSLAIAVVAAPRSSDPVLQYSSSTLPSRHHYHPAFTIHSVVVTGHILHPQAQSSLKITNTALFSMHLWNKLPVLHRQALTLLLNRWLACLTGSSILVLKLDHLFSRSFPP